MSSRIWRTSKAAGRPFPRVSDDDVLDYLVAEAVAVKVAREDEEATNKEEQKKWKKGKPGDALPTDVME